MIKKIVCAALMLALLATSSMGAFAAVTSSTEYAANGYITVTATVDDVNVGDTVTYLAYKEGTVGEGANDGNVAYIDQVTLEAGDIVNSTYKFTYTTKDTNIGSIVKQAGLRADGETSINVTEGTLPAPAGCVIKIGNDEYVIAEDPGDANYMEIAYGKVPSSVKKNGVEVEGWYATAAGFAIPGSLWEDGEVELTVTEAATATTVVLNGVKGYTNAKVAVVTVEGAAAKYGVIFSDDDSYTETDEITGADEVTVGAGKAAKFVALGKGSDGKFMIAVEGEFEAGSTFYAKAFADGITSGAYRTVTVMDEEYSN